MSPTRVRSFASCGRRESSSLSWMHPLYASFDLLHRRFPLRIRYFFHSGRWFFINEYMLVWEKWIPCFCISSWEIICGDQRCFRQLSMKWSILMLLHFVCLCDSFLFLNARLCDISAVYLPLYRPLRNSSEIVDFRGFWSEWGDLNTQPRHPKCRALPIELHPDIKLKMVLEVGEMWYETDYTRNWK